MNLIRSVLCSKGNGNVSRSFALQCEQVWGGEGSSTGEDKDERKAGGRIRKDVLAMVAQYFCSADSELVAIGN